MASFRTAIAPAASSIKFRALINKAPPRKEALEIR